ncbi:MAG: Fe-S protein assembly chaperone HscA [Magnetococcales bacterium]|nr:Fe-S protein assembly chaperone HscA [Magnetococcales bacterium]
MDVLLDIAEPDQSRKPHEIRAEDLRRVVGIDLGTTYSLAAAIDLEGKPACIPDAAGRFMLPSVVYLDPDGSTLVGWPARDRALTHPRDVIASVKRFMGRGLADIIEGRVKTPYELESGEGGMVRVRAGGGSHSPVDISAEILKTLRQQSEAALGGPLQGAVITVPAYFDDAQRQATKDAARLAGIDLLRLLNEPTAAALAYGLDQGKEGLYAIYDLGGGTFDISILKLTQGVFQVMATGGDSALGGDDFDQRLGDLFLEEMGVSAPSPRLMQEVKQEARRIKEALSQAESARAEIRREEGGLYHREVSREAFEERIADLIRLTGGPCRRAIKDSGFERGELQGVVLVGGSTRVPAVRRFVADLFGREPLCDLDPDQVVALGAAHQADLLGGNRRSGDLLLLDVTPLSLGLETMGGMVERIVPRNTPTPTARAQEFTTFKDGQTAMAIQVVQGEREMVDQCRSLARFELRGIPPMVAGAARIRVTFQIDADGLLTVSARELTTGVEQRVEVKPSYGLSDGEIERILRDALDHGEEDLRQRMLAESRVEAERVIAALGAALKADSALLSPEELTQVKLAMAKLWEISRGEDHEKINNGLRELDQQTRFFAQRRMDQTIQTAMAGHRLEEFEK